MEEDGMCRLCAQQRIGVDMLLKENFTLRDIVKRYLALEFIVGLPTHICLSCCTLLKTWDTFMQDYASSQIQFKSQLVQKKGLDMLNTESSLTVPTPGPAHFAPLPPKKRKPKLTSVSLFPSSPISFQPPITPDLDAGNEMIWQNATSSGSDTDDASECPPEVVHERFVKSVRKKTKETPVVLSGRKLQSGQPMQAKIIHQQDQAPSMLQQQHASIPLREFSGQHFPAPPFPPALISANQHHAQSFFGGVRPGNGLFPHENHERRQMQQQQIHLLTDCDDEIEDI